MDNLNLGSNLPPLSPSVTLYLPMELQNIIKQFSLDLSSTLRDSQRGLKRQRMTDCLKQELMERRFFLSTCRKLVASINSDGGPFQMSLQEFSQLDQLKHLNMINVALGLSELAGLPEIQLHCSRTSTILRYIEEINGAWTKEAEVIESIRNLLVTITNWSEVDHAVHQTRQEWINKANMKEALLRCRHPSDIIYVDVTLFLSHPLLESFTETQVKESIFRIVKREPEGEPHSIGLMWGLQERVWIRSPLPPENWFSIIKVAGNCQGIMQSYISKHNLSEEDIQKVRRLNNLNIAPGSGMEKKVDSLLTRLSVVPRIFRRLRGNEEIELVTISYID